MDFSGHYLSLWYLWLEDFLMLQLCQTSSQYFFQLTSTVWTSCDSDIPVELEWQRKKENHDQLSPSMLIWYLNLLFYNFY